MKALIFGVTGMVGSHLLDYLLDNTDWDIIGAARWRSPLDNVEHRLKDPRIKFEYCDINDYGSLNLVLEKHNPDYIFHLAAQSFPKDSFSMVTHTLQTNIIGTANILEVIKQLKQDPIIHVCSSSEVFGRVPREALPINEEVKFHPASPYAISKVGTDLLGRYYAEAYGMKVVVTRMFTHTGPRRGDVFAESTFAKQIAMIEAGQKDPVVRVGNLNSMRTWADVRDAVRAYHMLVTIDPIPGEYYNIGGNYSCTIGDMLNTLISYSTADNITIETDENRLRPIDADLQIPDVSKFKAHTGWEPEYAFETTMHDLLDYWRDRVKTRKVLER